MLCEGVVLMFKNVEQSAQLITTTLYTLQNYNAKTEILRKVKAEGKHNNIVNASNFLTEHEPMKSCIKFVESKSARMRL